MKLYYSAGSCSTSCHITLEESGLKYEAVAVDWDNPSDPNVALVTKLNPLGTLPILITDEGAQLDQNLAIHAYVADKAPRKELLPPAGSVERAEALNWLSFVCSDLHKSIGGLFGVKSYSEDPAVQAAVRGHLVDKSNELLTYLEARLAGKDYLMDKVFTAADAYAFVVLGWCQWLEIPLTPYPTIQKYLARVAARPAVAKVLKEEGLT
ncbi:MAG: glutathione binding-like protein [Oligoflexia bacterium]|nr:glutathione binding-like protein [Oligoflexia bacterium]